MEQNALVKLILAGAVAVGAVVVSPKMFEILDAGEIAVIQYPNGSLVAAVEPGFYMQWFGSVTKYPRREQYSFSTNDDKMDRSIKIQFNDGGNAQIYGVASWEMPKVPEMIIKIHKEFRSTEGIDQQLIRPAIENAMFMSGPLMSSTESSGERRAELLQFVNDQVQYGIYFTQRTTKKAIDQITGQPKDVVVSDLVQETARTEKNPTGFKRVSESPLTTFGIRMFPATINKISYDQTVQTQINDRQKQITEVQTAIAQAKKAEQQAITVAKEGEANAAKAKWLQEVEKAKFVTLAEQELRVAELGIKTAEARKRTAQLEGEGEAAKRAAVMSADGALDKKLDAWVKVNLGFAEALKTGKMVPEINLGGQGGNAVGTTTNMMDLLTIKTAKDLALDMRMTAGKGATVEKNAK